MSLIAEIEREHESLIAVRRDIHAHPELAFQETRTADVVARQLERWGIEVHRGIGKTGVVGVLRGKMGKGKRSIGLRADMDALPMPEHNKFKHASTNPGRMHACGHDGHTTMLLGARSTWRRIAISKAPSTSSSSRRKRAATPAPAR